MKWKYGVAIEFTLGQNTLCVGKLNVIRHSLGAQVQLYSQSSEYTSGHQQNEIKTYKPEMKNLTSYTQILAFLF